MPASYTEHLWDDPGVGAYYLCGAPELLSAFSTPTQAVGGRQCLFFSPVPRGWLEDSMNDGAAVAAKLLRSLTSGAKQPMQLPAKL